MQELTCLWNSSSVCVVDASGKIVREAKVASEPEALIGWFGSLGAEAGADRLGGGAAVAMALCGRCGRRACGGASGDAARAAMPFQAMPVKTDRNDARGIAQLMRLGWFQPGALQVDWRPGGARAADRAQAGAVEAAATSRYSLRGILRGFGLKVGQDDAASFAGRIKRTGGRPREPGDGRRKHCFRCMRWLLREFKGLEKRVRQISRADEQAQTADVDAGGRSDRGAHLCLRDRRSGALHIVEGGGSAFRADPEEVSVRAKPTSPAGSARSVTLRCARRSTRPPISCLTSRSRAGALKSWAMRIAKRAGMKKAKVALARKLAVVLHRMSLNATTFDFDQPSRCSARRGMNEEEFIGFGRVTTPGLPEAESRRRDDGRGQTESSAVALRPRVLVSVRTLHAGLQSFLSMRRIEARCKNASALRLRFSQSFANLRHRLSHAMERSTIHLFGRTTNLCSSLRLTISMIQSPLRAAAKAARSPR